MPDFDPDDPAFHDPGPEVMAARQKYFQDARDQLAKDLQGRYKGVVWSEITKLNAASEYEFTVARCASWALSEDLRVQFRRLLLKAEHMRKDSLAANKTLANTSAEGAAALVREIAELKRASDKSSRELVTNTRSTARATWMLAILTAILASVTGWVGYQQMTAPKLPTTPPAIEQE